MQPAQVLTWGVVPTGSRAWEGWEGRGGAGAARLRARSARAKVCGRGAESRRVFHRILMCLAAEAAASPREAAEAAAAEQQLRSSSRCVGSASDAAVHYRDVAAQRVRHTSATKQ